MSSSASGLIDRARRLGGVGGGCPAAEELERLFRARTGLGGVGKDRQPVVGGKVHPVDQEAVLLFRSARTSEPGGPRRTPPSPRRTPARGRSAGPLAHRRQGS